MLPGCLWSRCGMLLIFCLFDRSRSPVQVFAAPDTKERLLMNDRYFFTRLLDNMIKGKCWVFHAAVFCRFAQKSCWCQMLNALMFG